ncbi:zinc finger protein 638 isoform 2-T2 [Discoglossus pictus]
MFNPRGSFPGQRPRPPAHPRMMQPLMAHSGINLPGMNQQGMNLPGMNQQGMNLPGMNQQGMNLPGMNQQGMNLPGMNQQGMNLQGMNSQGMGHPGMNHPGMGMKQPGMNFPPMNQAGMNQGGMGFHPEMKSSGIGMRPHGIDPQGQFLGGNPDPLAMKLRAGGAPQGFQARFGGPNSSGGPGQPRMQSQNQAVPSGMNVLGKLHPQELLIGKDKLPLQGPAHHLGKDKLWDDQGAFGNATPGMSVKQINPQVAQRPEHQNRYTTESASSILQSFGLSNEDLEELSLYPDDQLTPANMPVILRDIRLRKIGHSVSTPDQGGGRRPVSEVVPSKVIDYGHSSKYQFKESPVSKRAYESSRVEEKSKTSQAKRDTQKPDVSKKPAVTPMKQTEKANKIPTVQLTATRKNQPVRQTSNVDRPHNKAVIGEQPATNKPEVPGAVISSGNIAPQPDTSAISHPDVQISSGLLAQNVKQMDGQTGIVVGQGTVKPAAETATVWPKMGKVDSQKMRKQPTPSMMNDYYAASPRIFPHICSLCNVECRHLKDWIKHQNTTAHIESCRQLRQQYPDWNPQDLTARNEDKKKDEPSRTRSKSKSHSPRRSRRSGSRYKGRRSHSRSPRGSGRGRSRSPRGSGRVRSRSPRGSARGRSRSPRGSSRGRSRSPRGSGRGRSRSRSPRRTSHHSSRRSASLRRRSRSPHRSSSPRRYRNARSSRTSSNSPDRKAVDAAVQNFIESSKKGTVDKSPAKLSSNGKKLPPKPSSATTRKPSSSSAVKKSSSTSASSSRKVSSSSNVSSTSNLKKPSLYTTRKPGTYSSVKKPYVHTPSGKKPASGSTNKEPDAAKGPLHKFKLQISKGTIIHATDLPDDGYTDQDLLKIVQPFGKVCDILIVKSKNEAYIETKFKEAAAAAVEFSKTTQVVIKNKKITLCLAGQNKPAPKKNEAKNDSSAKQKPSKQVAQGGAKPTPQATIDLPGKGPNVTGTVIKDTVDLAGKGQNVTGTVIKHNDFVPDHCVKRYRLAVPIMKDSEKCVVLVSNLPEGSSDLDEISNLAKPFGGVNDVLLISTHRKAYLELTSSSSVESMVKFYTVFPMYMEETLLSITVAEKFKDLKDENRIFTELIEESPFKITPTICEKFVYLDNLPEKGYTEFEIVCIGLRFGKVQHYAIISNKRRAILHMCSANAAKMMQDFLTLFPCSVGDCVLKCTLPSKTTFLEDEYVTFLEDRASMDNDSNVDDTEVAQTASEDTLQVQMSCETTSSMAAVTSPVTASANTCSDQDKQMVIEDAPNVLENSAMEQDVQDTAKSHKPDPLTVCKDVNVSLGTVQLKPVAERYGMVYQDLSVQVAGEDDEDEEAAEAPEATSTLYSYSESMVPVEEKTPVLHSQPLAAEELEVLVSVESECEEEVSDTECPNGQKWGCLGIPASDKMEATAGGADLLTVSEETEESEKEETNKEVFKDLGSVSSEIPVVSEQTISPKTESCEVLEEPKANLTEDSIPEPKLEEVLDCQKVEETKKSDCTKIESNVENDLDKTESNIPEIKTDSVNCSPINKQSDEASPVDAGDAKETVPSDPLNTTCSSSLTRTAKYNPQRGDISVTVTVDNQKPKTESRKRSLGERRSTGRESSTPRSNSNRSSPSDTPANNPKVISGSSQKRSSGKSVSSSPQEKDVKITPRSHDRDVRSSNRKDERIKSTSARYTRVSKNSTRGSKSKEEHEDNEFPFNLDEFVTVDEIVEEQTDLKNVAKKTDTSQTSSTPQKGKRKEHEQSTEAKKSKGKMDNQEPSFVTLDEVGCEEDNTVEPESTDSLTIANEIQSPVPIEKANVKDKKSSEKGPQMLMTLDEVSDEEDMIQDSDTRPEDGVPEDFVKAQLLVTLDEVSEGEEALSSHSEPCSSEVQPVEHKENTSDTKETVPSEIQESHPVVDQADPTEQPLLTLDEVKGDDDDSITDIVAFDEGHHFLTVDEVGEEEEDSSMTLETTDEASAKPVQETSKAEKESQNTEKAPVVTPKRGRPRKRPLPAEATTPPSKTKIKKEETKAEPKGSADQTSTSTEKDLAKGTDAEKRPSDPKPAGKDKKDSKSKPPQEEKKLESPPKQKPKLAPFNPSIPIGMEFLVPKTGYFCELCSLFYMDDASKTKHCKSIRHYQAVEKHMAKETESKGEESSSTAKK